MKATPTPVEGHEAIVAPKQEGVLPALEYIEDLSNIDEKVAFAASVVDVLKDIHAQGRVLNSVALDAIGVTTSGHPHFLDFKAARPQNESDNAPLGTLSHLHYLSPERTGKVAASVQRTSDYYALGVVLYRLLTGQFPFDSDDPAKLVSLHVSTRPSPPASLNPDIPANLSRIVEKLLEKCPTDRYQSADGILYDLANHAADGFELASRDAQIEFKTSAKIYGRRREIRRIEEAVRGIARGDLQVATISGYSGVGKSAIVGEFQRRREADGVRLISGKFQQYKKDIPYFAVAEAFEQLFDLVLLSSQAELDAFREAFSVEVGDQGLILTSIFPKLELIVGEQPPVEKLVGEEAENRFNYLFLKLIRIVANREHPLILFLDDLQWTDLVSLNVLRALIRSECGFLLLVLSYRSNEVDQHHPLQHFLNDVGASGVKRHEIRVQDLSRQDVSQLVSDSLGCENTALSDIVHKKTHGNAFFVHQLLKGLADRGLYQWSTERGGWAVDIDEVSSVEVSTNVVEFMQSRLIRFPPDVCDLLSVIGAVGHHADLAVISVVTGRATDDIMSSLELPFKDGLMTLRVHEVYFGHDRIQEACYRLNDSNELPRLHFTIAQTLMEHGRVSTMEEVFDLAGHLDKGFDYIGDDRQPYIEIYTTAARKSKEISAYKEFLVYIRQAMRLLRDTTPTAGRDAVYRDYHIALYLNSLFDEADAFFDDKLLNHTNILDLKENYFAKVSQGSMQGRYGEATMFAMSILRRMGIDLKIDPELSELAAELEEVEALLEQAGIEKISDLERIERRNVAEMELICEVILAAVPAAFFYNPSTACLLIFTTLKLATRNGVFEAMGYPLSVASTPFILVRNNYQAGYAFAEYAIQIAAGNKRSLGNAKHLFILFCWHWSRPIKDDMALEIAREAHHLLMQGGDIQMAGYTFYNTITYLWERGEPLKTVQNEAGQGLDFNVKTQNTHGVGLVTPHCQVVATLLSETADYVKLDVDGFDEDGFVADNAQNAMGLCFFYVYKTQLAYICGSFEDAYVFSVKARELLHFITGFPSTMSGIFYGALCRCERFFPGDSDWQDVLDDLEQLRQWNRGAPKNFEHKLLLLEAEVARKVGDTAQAIDRYSRAVDVARQNQFVHECALAQERFAGFWYSLKNTELGAYYLKGAYENYEAWGAHRKLCLLRQAHPDVFTADETGDLDLMSVIRAQNALAQETRIEQLLRQVMGVLLEFSGAEKALLILKGRTWTIEALNGVYGEEQILEGVELSDDLLSVQMVNYVIRTGEAAQIDRFAGFVEDPYIRRFHPESVLALPVATGGDVIAVIYLEHSKIHGMFTQSRQDAIRLLSTQVAISLKNAQGYNQLEDLVRERTAELAQQNEELGIARRQADRANAAKSDFIANMSHELRTPLNAVTGYSELLSSMVSDPKQRSYLTSIKTAGRNLLTLVNDILDLSKIEAGRMELHPAPVDLRSICAEIHQVLELKAAETDLSFNIEIADNLPARLKLDETRMRQILLNLVGNAIKFTENGFVTLRVHSSPIVADKTTVTLAVEDSGIGIPESEQERIFGVFDQQSNQDPMRFGGTGLGLSITRRLVDIMGGSLTLESAPGKGSVFTVRLSAPVCPASAQSRSQTDQVEISDVWFSPATVLVVDNVESNRALLTEMLSQMNLDVATAGNGQEALLVAGELHPALVLMDIRMPVMDGFEAVQRLKGNPHTQDIPVVALTASSTRTDKDSAMERGFDRFLSKPLNVQDFIAVLSDHLKRADEQRAPVDERPVPAAMSRAETPDAERLTEQLRAEALPLYRVLRKALVMGDARALAKLLKRLGGEHGAASLVEYANLLAEQVDMIDVPAIRQSLADLPRLLGGLLDVEECCDAE